MSTTESEPESETTETRELHLATWTRRFGAWLVDVLVVGVIADLLGGLLGPFPALLTVGWHPVSFGSTGLLLFVYWTALEGSGGQSLGKMALDLRVTDERGDAIGYGDAAIESFGKAFLLPLDCLVGWLAMPGQNLRLFNRISKTIVVKTPSEAPEGVTYVREK